MKTIIFTLYILTFNLYSQWIRQSVPSDIDMILSIDFIDQNSGVASGWKFSFNGKAIYTTNSGTTWLLASLPDSSRSMVKIQMLNSATGYIAGACNTLFDDYPGQKNKYINYFNNLPQDIKKYFYTISMTPFYDSYKGMFLKTTNGGQSWFTQGTLPADVYYLTGMQFINLNTGFVLTSLNYSGGIKSGVLKTTNGGLNWIGIYTMDSSNFNNIYTSDGTYIYVGGYKSNNHPKGFILNTTNSGTNWIIQNFSSITQFRDINFTSASTGFAATGDTNTTGLIYRTTNSGINWVKLAFQSPETIYYGIEFVTGTGKGIATGSKIIGNLGIPLISRTIDFGNNWSTYMSADSDNFLVSQSLINQNIWFVCGYKWLIYKSTNGGAIGIQPINSEIPKEFSLSQNYPNPFNPTTNLRFQISELRFVKLIVYSILGNVVETLVNEEIKPGTYEVTFNAANYSSGIYYYKLSSSGFTDTKKMVLVK